jgi:hypothetical protein
MTMSDTDIATDTPAPALDATTPPMVPSAAPTAAGAAMPLFFRRVVGCNPALHGEIRLDRSVGFGFAAATQAVPLGLGEMEAAAQFYPILFTTGPAPIPVALLGLREGQNLFVLPGGAWRPECYIPAYVRAFPFIFVEDKARNTTFVGMEPDAACLRTESGLKLFEDGQPSRVLTEQVNFCSSLRDNLVAAGLFGRALEAAGLLSEEEANISFTAGGQARIRGFKLTSADRVAQADDATFIEWRRRGWIGGLYAHLHSAGRWARLIDLAAARQAA